VLGLAVSQLTGWHGWVLTQVDILDYTLTNHINFEADINFAEDSGVVQVSKHVAPRHASAHTRTQPRHCCPNSALWPLLCGRWRRLGCR
jgi:hypothetical protein